MKKPRKPPQPVLEWKPAPGRDCLLKKSASFKGVLVNLQKGTYYTLNASAQFMWERMDGKTSVASIARKTAARFAIGAERASRDAARLMKELSRRGLISARGRTR